MPELMIYECSYPEFPERLFGGNTDLGPALVWPPCGGDERPVPGKGWGEAALLTGAQDLWGGWGPPWEQGAPAWWSLVNFYPPRMCSQPHVRNANKQALAPPHFPVGPDLAASFPTRAFAASVRFGGCGRGSYRLQAGPMMEASEARQASGPGTGLSKAWACAPSFKGLEVGSPSWTEAGEGGSPGGSGDRALRWRDCGQRPQAGASWCVSGAGRGKKAQEGASTC